MLTIEDFTDKNYRLIWDFSNTLQVFLDFIFICVDDIVVLNATEKTCAFSTLREKKCTAWITEDIFIVCYGIQQCLFGIWYVVFIHLKPRKVLKKKQANIMFTLVTSKLLMCQCLNTLKETVETLWSYPGMTIQPMWNLCMKIHVSSLAAYTTSLVQVIISAWIKHTDFKAHHVNEASFLKECFNKPN